MYVMEWAKEGCVENNGLGRCSIESLVYKVQFWKKLELREHENPKSKRKPIGASMIISIIIIVIFLKINKGNLGISHSHQLITLIYFIISLFKIKK